MEYTKPAIIAQSDKSGSFAAGCPANSGKTSGAKDTYKYCERGAKCFFAGYALRLRLANYIHWGLL
jgi:hypothetical protein